MNTQELLEILKEHYAIITVVTIYVIAIITTMIRNFNVSHALKKAKKSLTAEALAFTIEKAMLQKRLNSAYMIIIMGAATLLYLLYIMDIQTKTLSHVLMQKSTPVTHTLEHNTTPSPTYEDGEA